MNIALISNNTKLLKVVAHSVAIALNMFYIDAEEYIEYDLVEKERALQACSKEYLQLREQKAMQTICSYENMLLSVSEDVFISNQNIVQISCKTVYCMAPQLSQTSKQVVDNLKTETRMLDFNQVNHIIPISEEATDTAIIQIVQLFQNGSKS